MLQNIRKIVIKKSKKSFTLDPALYELKDQTVTSTKANNWAILLPELKKFGVKLDQEQLREILENRVPTMEGVIQQLFRYDQTVCAYPDIVGPTGKMMKSDGDDMNP